MTPPPAGPRTLVLGLGRFGGGVGAARYLARQGAPLRIADDAQAESLAESRRAVEAATRAATRPTSIDWHLGVATAEPTNVHLLTDVDRIVVNPAVPPSHPLLAVARERGLEITQEIALLLESFPGRVLVVTGTNGKSSTVTLLAKLLATDRSRPVVVGGNLGGSLLDHAPAPGTPATPEWSKRCVAVVELSSFQLERLDPERHAVDGAVLTSLGSDHLDRHGNLTEYWRLKARALSMAREFVAAPAPLLERLREIDSEPVRSATRYRVSDRPPGPDQVGRRDGFLWSGLIRDPGPILHAAAMPTAGGVWLDNAALATAAASHCGISRHAIGLGIATHPPLEHRLQRIATLAGGIEVWDDAVATSFDATLCALRAFDRPVHWVGGGRSKQPGRALEPAATEVPATGLRSAHLFGEIAPTLVDAIGDHVTTTAHRTLTEALDAALATAAAGEIVLFSPAFASFDQFVNYRERAAAFRAWVAGAE